MATAGRRPFGSFNFSVTFAPGRRQPIGFSEVVFPALPACARGELPADRSADMQPPALLLKRGFDGTLDLYQWWDQARRSRRSRPRTVTVALLDETLARAVVRWTFTGCRPLRLGYSRLDANASAVLIESLELTFEDVEMA